MKKTLIFISLILLIGISLFYLKKFYFQYREFMGFNEVCKRWGERAFDSIEFKKAGRKGESKRAKMTCSLIRNKQQYIGKKREDIRKILGNYTGHYFSDMYPTYIIETAKKIGEDSWQIVFLIDNKGKIKNIVVHKNCCSSWKDELLLRLPF